MIDLGKNIKITPSILVEIHFTLYLKFFKKINTTIATN